MGELYFSHYSICARLASPLSNSPSVLCCLRLLCVCARVRCPVTFVIITLFLLSLMTAPAKHVVDTRQPRP